jgi:hypothetical protein
VINRSPVRDEATVERFSLKIFMALKISEGSKFLSGVLPFITEKEIVTSGEIY